MRVCLVVRNKAQRGQRVKVPSSRLVIGRNEQCDLRVKSRSVSRRHCEVTDEDDRVLVRDLGSSNGTYVNDAKLPSGGSCRLYHRDLLQVGKLQFRLSVRDEDTELPVLRPVDTDAEGDSTFPTDALDFLAIKEEAFRKLGGEDDSEDASDADQSVETHQIERDELKKALESTTGGTAVVEPGDKDVSVEETSDKKSGPKKLPEHLRPKSAGSAQDAANDALKRLFGPIRYS